MSKRLEDRSLADWRQTFSTKVSGLRNLIDACHQQFGRVVSTHVLTSAYSIFGNDGQHDYGAANETLDRLCGLCESHHDRSWSSVAWLAWDGIGMTRGHRDVELSGPFDCLREITIGPRGRVARFAPSNGVNWSGLIPALLLDAAWRLGAMYAVAGSDELHVRVRIDRMVLAVGKEWNQLSASGWKIRSSAPLVENGGVRWERTEVLNEIGELKLLVEGSLANRLR